MNISKGRIIMPQLSIVIPVFNEEESLPYLKQRLDTLIDQLSVSYAAEVWLVDDHSTDRTPELLRDICASDSAYNFVRLAANSGSHIAIVAGLKQTQGDCVAILAADLQDPPELIPEMLANWQAGNHVVWAVREQREGISWSEKMTANLFYTLLNRFSEVKLPPTGADFSLLDRRVVAALLQSIGPNPSMGLEVARLGFKQVEIPYVKATRQYGSSKWNLRKKLNAFADAFVTTSYMPLRMMSYIGIAVSVLGFVYAILIVFFRLFNIVGVDGWAALMVIVLIFGGVQMIMLGVIGEYLWRTLEQARQRPLYFIEEASDTETQTLLEQNLERS